MGSLLEPGRECTSKSGQDLSQECPSARGKERFDRSAAKRLSGPARDRLMKAPIKEVAVTNTIGIPEDRLFDKLTVLSVGELLAKAVRLTHAEQSVSSLFEEQVPTPV